MSNGGGVIAGIVLFLIGIILIFIGLTVLEMSPEPEPTDDIVQEATEQLPRELAWAFIIGGGVSIFMGIIVLIGGASSGKL